MFDLFKNYFGSIWFGLVALLFGSLVTLNILSWWNWSIETIIWYGILNDHWLGFILFVGWTSIWIGISDCSKKTECALIAEFAILFSAILYIFLNVVFPPIFGLVSSFNIPRMLSLIFAGVCGFISLGFMADHKVSWKTKRKTFLFVGVVLLICCSLYSYHYFLIREINLGDLDPNFLYVPVANLSPLSNGVIAYTSDSIGVSVQFENAFTSVRANWQGDDAYLLINNETRIDGYPYGTSIGWGTTIITGATSEDALVSPSFSSSLILNEEDINNTIDVKAYINVSYPKTKSSMLFENKEATLVKTFQLYVTTPSNYNALQMDIGLKNMHQVNPSIIIVLSFLLWWIIRFLSKNEEVPK